MTAFARDVSFVDVASMGTVPGSGLGTPALASGPGAAPYAEMVNGLVETPKSSWRDRVTQQRNLLRSVVTEGETALVVETMEAASAHGEPE